MVTGHVWTSGPVRDAMYSFHMPFFFLLSGLLSRPHPVTGFARRQVATQLRPYAAFLILLVAVDQVIERAKGGQPIFHQWPDDLLPILLGGFWLRGPFTIFWFVPCLMMGRILFNVALARLPDPLDRRWAAVILPVALVAYGLGWWTQASPLGLLSVPMAALLLWAGAVWPRVRLRGAMVVPLGLAAVAGLAGLVPTLNMKAADYGWPLLSIGAGVATSLLLFRLSALVPAIAPLTMLGRASMVVMYLHVAVIHYLSPYLPKFSLLAFALILPVLAWQGMRRTFLRTIFL